MALTTSIITGRVPLPTDTAPVAAEIIFSLSDYDTEGAETIPPAQVRAILDAGGNLPTGFKLWRNITGKRATVYVVTARWSEDSRAMGKIPREAVLGRVQVGAQTSYSLASLLEATPIPTPPSTFWQTITQADYDEMIAAKDQSAADVTASEQAAAAAAAARDAAASAGLVNRGWVANAAALSSITTPVLNDRALTLDNEHSHRYNGTAWVDEGLSPTAAKMDKAGPRQAVLYASAAAIAVNTTAKTVTISGRVRSGERTVLLSSAALDYSALSANGQVLVDLTSGALSVVNQSDGVVTAGKAAIFQINPSTGILTGTLDGYTLNGMPMTGRSGLRRGSLGYGNASSVVVNVSAKTITFASGIRVLASGGTLTTSSQSLSYSSFTGLCYLFYGASGFSLSLGLDVASVTEERILVGTFDAATGYFTDLSSPYTTNGVEIGPRGGLRYAMALTLPDRFDFDFNASRMIIGANNPVLVEGSRVMMAAAEVDLTVVNADVWGVVLVNRTTGAVSVASSGFGYDRNLLVVGGFRRDQKRVSGFDNYSINGVPNNQAGGGGRFANVTLGWDLPGVYTAPEMPSYETGQPVSVDNVTSADVYGWYDDLADAHPDYITKTHLGDDDTDLPIYEYRFKPKGANVTAGAPDTVRIQMDAGIHPEFLSPMYLFHAMDQIANHWSDSPLLEALRYGVEFAVVPVVCPWTIDNRPSDGRVNSNGVNINRNFPAGWRLVTTPPDQASGPTPLSEPESQYIYALMQEFRPHIYMNGHTRGNGSTTGDNIWVATSDANEWFFDLGAGLATRMRRKWAKDYPWFADLDTAIQVSNGYPPLGSAVRAAASLGALAWDVEANPQLPYVSGSKPGDPRALRLIVEWLINVLVATLRKHIR